MLTEGEVRALTVLRGEQTVSELATNLDRSLSYTSELVEQLETAGLVEFADREKQSRYDCRTQRHTSYSRTSPSSIHTSTGRSCCQGLPSVSATPSIPHGP